MRRRHVTIALAAALMLAVAAPAGAHELFDHDAPAFAPTTPPSPTFLSGGDGASWELVATIPTGNPHTDLDFFTQGEETYASVGTLAVGPNAGGQTIVQLTEGGEINPSFVSSHPSASCISNPAAALGLQHDVEASPKGDALLNTRNPFVDTSDTQLIIDATDAEGRCHDQGDGGLVGAPQGGLEIVDVTDIDNPVEIGLTSHIGEAHTVNVDPKRPHIAYAVTSDSVTINNNGTPNNFSDDFRENEVATDSDRFDLDGFEVVDMSSCMNFPEDTSVEAKRAQCRPEVFRYRYPSIETALGHTSKSAIFGCHELEVYPNDRLTCGSGAAAVLFDISQAFDKNGTPGNFSDDHPKGEPLPCSVRPSSTSIPFFFTGAMVTDCVVGQDEQDLTVAAWLAAGAPSLEGVTHIGTAHHQGRGAGAYDSTEDIDFDHEAELTRSGRFIIATDERGGGVTPPGATCVTDPIDNVKGNGGLHAYAVNRLSKEMPDSAEEAFESYARTPGGDKAIYRAEIHTQPQGTVCTAHVFQQMPGQNRIFMGWYSQGTQVVDYVEHADGSFEFKPTAYFIPLNANEWVSHIFKCEKNEDGTFTYYGAAGDFNIGAAGRNAIDIYKVTLPAPAKTLGPTRC